MGSNKDWLVVVSSRIWAHVLKYTRSPSRAGFFLILPVGVRKSKKRKKSKKVYILSGPCMVYSKR